MKLRSFGFLLLALFSVGALLGGCGGGTASRLTPQRQTLASEQSNLSATALPPTHLWFAFCLGCGIAVGSSVTAEVDVLQTNGTPLQSLNLATAHDESDSPPTLTSPDQRHEYVTFARFGTAPYIADIDAQTYGVRYYYVPNGIAGLAISPDGTRLYVPGISNLTVINTVSRTYAAVVPVALRYPAMSPDGRTLYGVTPRGLTAIDTTTLIGRVFAADPGANAMAASSTRLYVEAGNRISIYDATTHLHVGQIGLPSLPERMALDNTMSRLFVWIEGATSNDTIIIDTSKPAILKTLPGATLFTVDPVTHVMYGTDSAGYWAAFTPPSYSENRLFSAPNVYLGASVTTTN